MRRKGIRWFALNILLFSYMFFSLSNNFCIAKAAETGERLSLDAKGAILIEGKSGKVLYHKNERDRLYPASTTKILTALVALERGNLDEIITVGKEVMMIPWDSSKAYLKEGEQLTLRELILGLMLPSGNDAAATIAVYIGRKAANDISLDEASAIERFVELMNERAKEAGAVDSNFVNPHGYHHKDHYTTAYDLALIAKEAMKIDFFREVVGTSKYSAEDKYVFNSGQVEEIVDHTWKNTNELIVASSEKNYYEYATGIKTGYTAPAGFCVVSSASKGNMDLIAVVLGSSSQSRWEDSRKLLEYGFENYGYYEGANQDQVLYTFKVQNPSFNSPEDLVVIADGDFADTFYKDEAMRIEKEIIWDDSLISLIEPEEGMVKLRSSIEDDQVIGKAVFTLDGNVLGEISLKALEGVKKQSIMGAIVGAIGVDNISWFFVGMLCGAAGVLGLFRWAVKRRRRM